jgi:hypothetical protein
MSRAVRVFVRDDEVHDNSIEPVEVLLGYHTNGTTIHRQELQTTQRGWLDRSLDDPSWANPKSRSQEPGKSLKRRVASSRRALPRATRGQF